jgi:hypothetical protein
MSPPRREFGKRNWEVAGRQAPRCRFKDRDVDNGGGAGV